MPILSLTLSAPASPTLLNEIALALTEATAKHLHKDPSLTAVKVHHVPAGEWFIGGTSLQNLGIGSFSLDIKVTLATNTKAEMSAYVEDVFALMGRLLGPVHNTSYIVVNEVPAHAWGFGGFTQEYRSIAAAISRHGKEAAP